MRRIEKECLKECHIEKERETRARTLVIADNWLDDYRQAFLLEGNKEYYSEKRLRENAKLETFKEHS